MVLVAPLVGVTESQLPPEEVAAAAVKLTLPLVLVTERLCGAGLEPADWPLKVSADGATESTGWADTVNVTG